MLDRCFDDSRTADAQERGRHAVHRGPTSRRLVYISDGLYLATRDTAAERKPLPLHFRVRDLLRELDLGTRTTGRGDLFFSLPRSAEPWASVRDSVRNFSGERVVRRRHRERLAPRRSWS